MPAIFADRITKVFGHGETEVVALKDATVEVERGELVALMGPSGSGKTTLLRAISLIDPPTTGRIIMLAGEPVYENDRVLVDDRRLRREKMGIIFQSYNLIPFLSVASVADTKPLLSPDRSEPELEQIPKGGQTCKSTGRQVCRIMIAAGVYWVTRA